jgi:hypothetical protein
MERSRSNRTLLSGGARDCGSDVQRDLVVRAQRGDREAFGGNRVTLDGTTVNSNQAVWSPDGKRFLGYVVDPSTGANIALGVFDPSGRSPPVMIPVAGYGSASWQRLAP